MKLTQRETNTKNHKKDSTRRFSVVIWVYVRGQRAPYQFASVCVSECLYGFTSLNLCVRVPRVCVCESGRERENEHKREHFYLVRSNLMICRHRTFFTLFVRYTNICFVLFFFFCCCCWCKFTKWWWWKVFILF